MTAQPIDLSGNGQPILTLEDLATAGLLTVIEHAKFMRVDRGAVYRGIKSGDIPCVRLGRNTYVPATFTRALLGMPDPWASK